MLRLLTKKKALTKADKRRASTEPVEDFLALEGSLAHKAIKGKTIDQIIEIEEKAWEKEAVKRYLKTLKR